MSHPPPLPHATTSLINLACGGGEHVVDIWCVWCGYNGIFLIFPCSFSFKAKRKRSFLRGGFCWKGQLQSFGIFQLLHLTSHTVIWALEGHLRMATPLFMCTVLFSSSFSCTTKFRCSFLDVGACCLFLFLCWWLFLFLCHRWCLFNFIFLYHHWCLFNFVFHCAPLRLPGKWSLLVQWDFCLFLFCCSMIFLLLCLFVIGFGWLLLLVFCFLSFAGKKLHFAEKKSIQINTLYGSYRSVIRMNHTDQWSIWVIRISDPYGSYGIPIRMTHTDFYEFFFCKS